ncbi:Anti-sigma regulatory factor (Ser/Thr protein kinase) [Desulfofundulus australicus DSM 11792]|uniref:Anti-sigma regulatory factor (Ser/Thr protein kinase) n=1 Tax=Desulfofundulus australicus DSM 11792 TaxID=1121425 RepID=A0A1M4UDF0_9FIRM|nr:ATP-binding protein [Desulfofundulus australicus]SHE54613.1 Anti-sigma regulatory factor (Ser/Thr protein kinase) [Desulfofundulus australicus DSM 11792]
MQLKFQVQGMDFSRAGQAATKIKKALQLAGMDPATTRKAIIIAYEAEMNIVIHACHGSLTANITPRKVEIIADDEGPGIPDISLAMQEGYSTAPPHIREMGFGAGMGLPNIKKSADELDIRSEVNKGTRLWAVVFNN